MLCTLNRDRIDVLVDCSVDRCMELRRIIYVKM